MLNRFLKGRVQLFPFFLSLLFFLPLQHLGAIEPLPGFTDGVSLGAGNPTTFSSPLTYDIDNNPENGKEIIVASTNGALHAYSSTGEFIWRAGLPNEHCDEVSNSNKLLSSPAIAEIDGDGIPYVVVGYGGVGGKSCGGGVAAFNAQTGERKWLMNHQKYNDAEGFWSYLYSVYSTPGLYDTDRDGVFEIGYGSFDRRVYLLSNAGIPIWTAEVGDTVWSSPAFSFIDSEDTASLFIGTDISKNEVINPPTPNGGYLYRFKTVSSNQTTTKKRRCKRFKKRGKIKKFKKCKRRRRAEAQADSNSQTTNYHFRDPDSHHWYTVHDQAIFSAPIVADLLPEEEGKEVLMGSGCFFPQESNNKRGKWLKILSAKTGEILRILDAPGCNESSPTVADLDGDGTLEVISTFNIGSDTGGGEIGQITAYNPVTGEILWQTTRDDQGNDSNAALRYSVVTADLNGDGGQEVIAMNSSRIRIYDGVTGALLGCDSELCLGGFAKFRMSGTGRNTPVIDDINGDGELDIIASAGGKIYAWTDFSDLTGTTPGLNPAFTSDWPMWRGNPARTGEYTP